MWPAESGDLDRVAGLLAAAERLLILAGRGVLLTQAAEPLREVGDRLGALFMTSVMAANAFNSPWGLGIAGGFTRSHRLDVARQADLVLVVGASLNTFQTRYGTLFPEDTKIVRVDNEPDHPHCHYHFLLAHFLLARPGTGSFPGRVPFLRAERGPGRIRTGWTPEPACRRRRPGPAGVSVARPERTTVLVSGDGGGLMGLADFETFLRATRKGVVVVLNDSAYRADYVLDVAISQKLVAEFMAESVAAKG